ncbi:MAG: DUF3794 domain-containing protein [Eubacterium sp.]|nr:DUF3794 domain-containing protein [Eubacterium sp.]
MKTEKKPVRSGMQKLTKNIQITLDEDMNVPDTCPDVEKIVESRGDLHIDEIEGLNDRVRVKGTLLVEILYISMGKKQGIAAMEHEFAVEEYINAEGAGPEDTVKITADIEDITVSIINSRKCGIRSVLFFHVQISEMKLIDWTTGIDSEDDVECLYEDLPVTEIAMNKKDIQRIRAEVSLPAGKPNIREILWNSMRLNDVDVRMLEGKLSIRGELFLFILYESEDTQDPVQYYDWEIPFDNVLECTDSHEDLIGSIAVALGSRQSLIKPDSDGELRSIEVDAVMELDLKACREFKLPVLKDLYANNRRLTLERKPVTYENLVFQNNARTKVTHRIPSSGEKGQLMQILNVEGAIRIEDSVMTKKGIRTEGLVFARVLYIAGDDGTPVQSRETVIPFEYLVECPDSCGNIQDVRCDIRGVLEQINAYVVDGDALEIRAVAGIYVAGYEVKKQEMIENVTESPYDEAELAKIPSITAYIVKKEDSLWMIARTFGTTIEKIRQYNDNVTEPLEAGQKLILLKEMENLIG